MPAAAHEAVIEVKKSRFIARAAMASDRAAAMALLERARKDYPDARHHCWAYLIGNPETAATAAMNDAGEPSGTAGKPILNVIRHKGIGDVMVVVSRYFGGIKLGAGGLTRAYSGAAEAVLSELPLAEQRPMCELQLSLGFAQEQPLRHWADTHEASIISLEYAQGVTAVLSLPEVQREALLTWCLAEGVDVID